MSGSPPRGRGRHPCADVKIGKEGLTPARAGTAAAGGGGCDTHGAHPRAGGDGPALTRMSVAAPGSPPRGRGRRLPGSGHSTLRRLTPARAGTARSPSGRGSSPRAHPRAGGDGLQRDATLGRREGSPPRGRGRRRAPGGRRWLGGLTPARAGTARAFPPKSTVNRAHPRAGGDGSDQLPASGYAQGSPPRGRGRRYRPDIPGSGAGLTPARAGTATGSGSGRPPRRAHPRAGGDGRRRTSPALPPPGLTPARAGTAGAGDRPCRGSRAHPRAGGDGAPATTSLSSAAGSPPRGRGRRCRGRY